MDSRIRSKLENIFKRSWASLHDAKRKLPGLLHDPSFPIPFWGDLEAYVQSSIRIVSVAKNPGNSQFEPHRARQFFPTVDWDDAADLPRLEHDFDRHLGCLSSFFRHMAPQQSKWFKKLRPVLQALHGDYWPGATNTVVHTDFASPLATAQKWAKLERFERRLLQDKLHGCDIWHDLICVLEPQLILFAGGKNDLDDIRFALVSAWQELNLPQPSSGGTVHSVRTTRMRVQNRSTVDVVFARNNVSGPFSVGKANQIWLGERSLDGLTKSVAMERVESEIMKSPELGISR